MIFVYILTTIPHLTSSWIWIKYTEYGEHNLPFWSLIRRIRLLPNRRQHHWPCKYPSNQDCYCCQKRIWIHELKSTWFCPSILVILLILPSMNNLSYHQLCAWKSEIAIQYIFSTVQRWKNALKVYHGCDMVTMKAPLKHRPYESTIVDRRLRICMSYIDGSLGRRQKSNLNVVTNVFLVVRKRLCEKPLIESL